MIKFKAKIKKENIIGDVKLIDYEYKDMIIEINNPNKAINNKVKRWYKFNEVLLIPSSEVKYE